MNNLVSIIIRTYNEEGNIGNCLTKVFNQSYRDFEVIIVDSESKDNTLKIASKFPVRIIRMKKADFSFGKSLNIGCFEAKGKYCVSLSAHATPVDNSWLENLIEPFENEMIAGVYAREIPQKDCNLLEMRKILGTFGNKEKIQTEDCFFSNVSSVFKKDLWEDVKFNEKISTTEDHLWASQMIKKGYAIYYQPKAKVYHSHNHSLGSLYERIKGQVYDKYKKVENKNALYICCKGFTNFIYSVIADWIFIFKNKKSAYWLFAAIPYNIINLIAFISTAFKK
jgi:glycosyltransferase involved in cell wall biosynthesis